MGEDAKYEKHDECTMKKTASMVIETNYDYDFLVSQKIRIEAELALINTLLEEANKLKLVSKYGL